MTDKNYHQMVRSLKKQTRLLRRKEEETRKKLNDALVKIRKLGKAYINRLVDIEQKGKALANAVIRIEKVCVTRLAHRLAKVAKTSRKRKKPRA